MPLNFKKHAEKGEEFIKLLINEFGGNINESQAGRLLQATFKTLRNHLTLEENFQLLAQLPMALKALYVTGWSPSKKVELSKTRIGFVEDVINTIGTNFWRDFSDIDDGEFAVLTVFNTMRKYISEGEFKDVEAVLPTEIKELISNSDYH